MCFNTCSWCRLKKSLLFLSHSYTWNTFLFGNSCTYMSFGIPQRMHGYAVWRCLIWTQTIQSSDVVTHKANTLCVQVDGLDRENCWIQWITGVMERLWCKKRVASCSKAGFMLDLRVIVSPAKNCASIHPDGGNGFPTVWHTHNARNPVTWPKLPIPADFSFKVLVCV